MPIEPHAAVTVSMPRILPPEPQAKIKVPMSEAFYAELLAKDARRCNKRLSRVLGYNTQSAAVAMSEQSRREAEARRHDLARKALDLLRAEPMTTTQLLEALGVRKDAARAALRILRGEELVNCTKSRGNIIIWEARA